MRYAKILFLLAIGLFCSGQKASAWTHGLDPAPVVSCNFVTGVATGVGAGTCVSALPACDGVTDDTASWATLGIWAVSTWQPSHTGLIEVVIPAGRNCKQTDFHFTGILKLRVTAYGATVSGNFGNIAGGGQAQGASNSTRLMSVSAGATSVTVNPTSTTQPSACNSNATCTALFSVGGWAMVAGFDLQSGSGFPSNPAYFQYVHITAINAATGVIAFDAPLTDTYLSTWPNYNRGDSPHAQPDDGGPATLYFFPGWDTEVEWRGVTFRSVDQFGATGRKVILRDTVAIDPGSGRACVYPSQTLVFEVHTSLAVNCTAEPDKMNESVLLDNYTINQLNFQSAGGAKNLTVIGSTVFNFVGTPANTTITGSTITGDLLVGPTLYGRGNTLRVTNSAVASVGTSTDLSPGGSHANYGALFSGATLTCACGTTGFQNIPGLSVSSGVIGIPNAYIVLHASDLNVMGWAQPGTNSCWSYDTNNCSNVFQIQSVAQDGSGNYSTAVTISNASPGVVGMTAHVRSPNDVVSLAAPNGGTLPSPLVSGQLYYVKTVIDANNFTISATLGGAAINTTTVGSGTFVIATGKTYITTNMLGGVLPTVVSGDLTIKNVPNTASYFSGCSVSLDCIGLNAAAAQGKPLNTYSKRTYANANTGGNQPYWPIFGNLQKMNVTVNTAYTGSLGATITPNTLFGLYLNSAGADAAYTPAIVNTKVAGTRTLDATGGYPAAWSGSAGFPFAGDTLNSIAASRFATASFRSVSDDISSDPGHPMSVTVEVVTDMGLVIP